MKRSCIVKRKKDFTTHKSAAKCHLQAEFVYRQIWKLIAAQNTGSVGILYRNHLSSLVICAYFRKQNLRFSSGWGDACDHGLPFLPEVLQEIRNAERLRNSGFHSLLRYSKNCLRMASKKEMERYCRKTGAYMRDQDGILSLIWYLCSVRLLSGTRPDFWINWIPVGRKGRLAKFSFLRSIPGERGWNRTPYF